MKKIKIIVIFQFAGTSRYDKNFEALLKVVIEWVEKSAPNDKLAKIGKIINLQDDDGQTVMHYAISEKWPNKYKELLLQWGANIAIKNCDGKYRFPNIENPQLFSF